MFAVKKNGEKNAPYSPHARGAAKEAGSAEEDSRRSRGKKNPLEGVKKTSDAAG